MRNKTVLLILALALTFCSCANRKESSSDNWNPTARKAIDDLIELYAGTDAPQYAVFDFDNTTCIFDVAEQLMTFQLEAMSFEMDPDAFRKAMLSGMDSAPDTLKDKLSRASDLYASLYDVYGPFSCSGLAEDKRNLIVKDTTWLDFVLTVSGLSKDITRALSALDSYVWVIKLYSGMSGEQLYELASSCYRTFASTPTTAREWVLGDRKYEWQDGVSVTDEVRSLWKDLSDNGIDVWVCSASALQPVMAAVDVFGLHDFCKGVLALTLKKDGAGKLLPEYDFENGCASIALPGGQWQEGTLPTRAVTGERGKITAIQNAIAPLYDGSGPVAGFADSGGDFCFCTEFASMNLVICFNRANRKVTEGGALLAEVAMYQEQALGYDLKKAMDNGDTFYVLQGRDENGLRTLRKSVSTIQFGSSGEKLFFDEKNAAMLEYFKKNGLSTSEIFNKFSIFTPSSSPDNRLGFDYGFVGSYAGYHNIH